MYPKPSSSSRHPRMTNPEPTPLRIQIPLYRPGTEGEPGTEPATDETFVNEVTSPIRDLQPDPNHRAPHTMHPLTIFSGSKDGRENPVEFIEDVESQIKSDEYPIIAKVEQAIRVQFRTHLSEKALDWYRDLTTDIRSNWNELKTKFVTKFKIAPRQDRDPNRYFNLVYNLKQRGRSIVTYVEEAEKLHRACPSNLLPFLPHQFVAGLNDESKIEEVQIYLYGKELITYPDARDVVVRSYQRMGRASPFDMYNEPEPEQRTPQASQTEVNAGLLGFFNELRARSQTQKWEPVNQYHTPPPQAPIQSYSQAPIQGYSQAPIQSYSPAPIQNFPPCQYFGLLPTKL